MAPRRPPPLPKSLFQSHGTPPVAPLPSAIHPRFILDAHAASRNSAAEPSSTGHTGVEVKVTILVVRGADGGAEDDHSQARRTRSLHPHTLDLSSSAALEVTAGNELIDLIVPGAVPISEGEWDNLESLIKTLDEGRGSFTIASAMADVTLSGEQRLLVETSGHIVISGLLPPPITYTSDNLSRNPAYDMYIGRLNQLSLYPHVHIKALPPLANPTESPSWIKDRKELERVLRMYREPPEPASENEAYVAVSPALECFGAHRIIYGSSPAGAGAGRSPAIPSDEWCGVLRKVVTELGEGQEAVDAIFGGNAIKVYGMA